MAIEIREVGGKDLEQYGEIPIRFRVDSILRVDEAGGGLDGLALTEETVEKPYVKDYDEDDPPARWRKFDMSEWLFLMAFDGDLPAGGAIVALRSPNVHMLEGRTDLAVLWDIRVHPEYRRRGIGASLLRRAAEWARSKDCKQLKIETQNVNVRACRFYAAQGCHLGSINRYGYSGDPAVAQETMLLWYLDLEA